MGTRNDPSSKQANVHIPRTREAVESIGIQWADNFDETDWEILDEYYVNAIERGEVSGVPRTAGPEPERGGSRT